MISGVNTDLLSKIGTGASKKSAPAAKLGKTSAAAENSGAGAFAEQLDFASRGPTPRSPEAPEETTVPARVPERAAEKSSRVLQEETRSSSDRGEFAAPLEARPAGTGSVRATQAAPVPPESFSDEEEVPPAQVAGTDLPGLNPPASLKIAKKGDETASLLEPARSEQGQVRRQAMQDFMNQMQREFGIPPEKIVDAFSRMDQPALMRPPEEMTQQFLANLEVPVSRQARAAELYTSMVRATGEAALNEKLIGAEQGLKMTVLSPRDESLRKLNEAIDQLNNSFALRGQAQVTSLAAPLDNPQKAQFALEQMNLRLAQMGRSSSADQEAVNPASSNEDAEAILAALADASVEGSEAGGIATPLMAGALASPVAAGAEMASSSGQQFGGDGRAPSQQPEAAFPAQMKKDAAVPDNTKTFGKKLAMEKSSPDGEARAAKGDANLAVTDGQAAPVGAKAAAAGPAGMMIQRPTPSAEDEQANVKELIRQAQLAIKKGGGEIKMSLKPEGIGQLHLKVSVENGQVNVQMLTDNDASKRLLEKGLHELKSNLAAHELQVDNMKVDVGQELKKHMDNSGDQAREQTRQFAADVMSQFREERQAFRDGFMQNQGWRQFGRNYGQMESGRGDAGSPETNVAPASVRARARNAYSSGRLNLVA